MADQGEMRDENRDREEEDRPERQRLMTLLEMMNARMDAIEGINARMDALERRMNDNLPNPHNPPNPLINPNLQGNPNPPPYPPPQNPPNPLPQNPPPQYPPYPPLHFQGNPNFYEILNPFGNPNPYNYGGNNVYMDELARFNGVDHKTEMLEARVNKMQAAFRKAHGNDEFLYHIGVEENAVRLPLKFKVDGVEKFDGIGDPRQHLRQYISFTNIKQLDKQQAWYAFQMTLKGAAAKWYHTVDPFRINTWETLVDEFIKQFAYNTQVDITLRDLETTKQKAGETFSEFIIRWREKASTLVTKPAERDQVKMIVKNLDPAYRDFMLPQSILTFNQLCDIGSNIEDEFATEMIDGGQSQS